jgi:hypothetical protein
MTMPKELTANSGIDALVHAIEAYVSVLATDFTYGHSLQAINLIFNYLPRAFKAGTDRKAREKVHFASTIAGMAFGNAFLGICHSMAHKLGSIFHIPHGLANALLISQVIKYNSVEAPRKQTAFPQYKYPHAALRYARIADHLGLGGKTEEEKVDRYIVERFLENKGTRVVCGGTTSNIVSRITGKDLDIKFRTTRGNDLPPYGLMEGLDLVTEGVLTLQKLNKLLGSCEKNMFEYEIEDEDIDGAHKMFSMLRDSDEIEFLVGRKVNAFYQNPALPFDMSIRSSLIRDITGNLERLEKKVTTHYC